MSRFLKLCLLSVSDDMRVNRQSRVNILVCAISFVCHDLHAAVLLPINHLSESHFLNRLLKAF